MSELSRRELLVRGSGAAAAAAAAFALGRPATTLLPGTAGAATTTGWNHDPGSPIGPFHWADIDPTFGACATGTRQSPVNIETARVGVAHGAPLQLRYHASELAVENTGHVVEVPIPAGADDVLQIGGDRYTLSQYHFHAPSEHTVNGRNADVEGHFVHTNAAGDTAVVGVLYGIGARPNPLLDTILLAAPDASGEEIHVGGEANPADLFRHLAGARAEARPRARRLVLRLRRLTHDPRLHGERPVVRAGRRRAGLAGRRGALPRGDRPIRRLRGLPQQQPPGAAAQRPDRSAPARRARPSLIRHGANHPDGTMPRRAADRRWWQRRDRAADPADRSKGDESMPIGPVQLIALGFDRPNFHGEIIAELGSKVGALVGFGSAESHAAPAAAPPDASHDATRRLSGPSAQGRRRTCTSWSRRRSAVRSAPSGKTGTHH